MTKHTSQRKTASITKDMGVSSHRRVESLSLSKRTTRSQRHFKESALPVCDQNNDQDNDQDKISGKRKISALEETGQKQEERKAIIIEQTTPSSSTLPDQLWITSELTQNSSNEEEEGEEEDEEEVDWEDIALPDSYLQEKFTEAHIYNDVHVVLQNTRPPPKKSVWDTTYERMLREWMHNSHVATLIAHFIIRNQWCIFPETLALCYSVVPHHVQTQCSRQLDSNSDFTKGIQWLLTWWKDFFTITGSGLITRSFNDYGFLAGIDLIENRHSLRELLLERGIDDGDTILGLKDFTSRLVIKSGTRDTSAELFVAVLRALNYDARLVCSLQPMPYHIPAKRPNKKDPTTQEKRDTNRVHSIDIDFRTTTNKDISPKEDMQFSYRAPRVKSKPSVLNEWNTTRSKPPTVWCEVYTPHENRWICVDPVRGIYDKPKSMEPIATDRQNMMSYVFALGGNRDGCIDVTRRYSSRMAKVHRLRHRELTKREREGGFRPWSELLISALQPNTQSERKRQEEEEEELKLQKIKEPMPTSIQGFKNHSLYALERHLKKFQCLYPKEPIVGHIKGEPVYLRSSVKKVHTRDQWLRLGLVIKQNEQPIKQVKATPVSISGKRALEEAKLDGISMQSSCYGEWQTTPYVAEPVINGRVSKNKYGAVYLFTPTMLPEGASYIPNINTKKIATEMGIDFAPAVVGYEFIKKNYTPTVNGIVVPKENESVILSALKEYEERLSLEKAKALKEKAYEQWNKLIRSILIESRINDEYGK
ncbi:hypothetical protein BDF14DRAFT_1850765 [Spinellus fusiger]|nr:hypothetical protein BDF14DRAFT_1850765 [Spinellus fusiger]